MRTLKWIVVHTCGSYDAKAKRVVHQPVEVVRRFHMTPVAQGGKGWSDLGYHRYIEMNGTNRTGRADVTVGAHASGFNAQTLGVCCSGHGDYEPFNPAQMRALIEQCAAWCRFYKLSAGAVIGHRETDEHGGPPVWKTCPGNLVDMTSVRELVRAELLARPLGRPPLIPPRDGAA